MRNMRNASHDSRHESSHSCRRIGHAHQRGVASQAQADDRDRRQADPLAHHEDLLALRDQRFRDLPRLQGLRDQGIFRQLLPAHVRRHLRHGARTGWKFTRSMPSLARDAGRHRRGDADRRPAEARRTYLGDETFCFTYGDGVADIDIRELDRLPPSPMANWPRSPRCSRPAASARCVSTDARSRSFQEKPAGDGAWINGGFFVLDPEVIDYIEGDQTSGRASRWEACRETASSRPITTRVSGSRWTRCATRTISKSCGSRAARPGKSGT